MVELEFHDIDKCIDDDLILMYDWLTDCVSHREMIVKDIKRIMLNANRTARAVKAKDGLINLCIDNYAQRYYGNRCTR